MDAPTLLARMLELDPTFVDSVEKMFGGIPDAADLSEFAFTTGGVSIHDAMVAKMMPSPPDVSTSAKPKKPPKPKVPGARKPATARRATATGPVKPKGPKAPEPIKPIQTDSVLTKRKGGTLKRLVRRIATPEHAAVAAAGGATGVAASEARKPKNKRQTIYTARSADQVLYGKSDAGEVTWRGTFSKFDEDKRLAFGWASVVSLDGEPVLDKQGDLIDPDEIEKAAYQYMLVSRKGGEMHKRTVGPDGADEPVHVADIVESFVVTPEKIEKMGLPAEMPQGWWVGYKVNDDAAWEKVKSGQYQGFSIHGRGRRTPVEY